MQGSVDVLEGLRGIDGERAGGYGVFGGAGAGQGLWVLGAAANGR